MRPLASHDAEADWDSITWPKCHIASLFDHLDLTNGMMPLMTLLESCDTDTSINGIISHKKLSCTSFWLFWLNNAIDDANGITQWNISCCLSLWSFWCKRECCHWWHCQHHAKLTPSINGIAWRKIYIFMYIYLYCILFQLSWHSEYNGAIGNGIVITCC